jgi:CRISPR system Cascade subunit CasC
MFFQLHTMTGYPGVLLNRDDAGLAKRLTYGESTRTRLSSQSAKRKLRLAEGENSLRDCDLGISVRSRETFKRCVARPLIAAGHDEAAVVAASLAIMDRVYKPSAGAQKKRAEKLKEIAKGEAAPIDLLERGEINVLSKAEIDYLRSLVETCVTGKDEAGAKKAAETMCEDKEFVGNLQAVGRSMSLDVAMFGRMTTGDVLSTVDAAVHVAHAITVHAQSAETDFFTAVDDLVTGDGDNGGGHLGETELTSPLFYGYYVVDLRQLARNLEGVDNAAEVASVMVGKLVKLIAENIVGAKKGSTAPYSSADMLFVEFGSAQPRTLAEAFRKPSKPTLEAAVTQMSGYLQGKDRMYGVRGSRLVAAVVETDPVFGEAVTVSDLADRVSQSVKTIISGLSQTKAA